MLIYSKTDDFHWSPMVASWANADRIWSGDETQHSLRRDWLCQSTVTVELKKNHRSATIRLAPRWEQKTLIGSVPDARFGGDRQHIIVSNGMLDNLN